MTIPRIAICVPTRDTCAAEFTHSLVKMVGRFSQHYVADDKAELVHLFDLGTLLPDMRNTLAEQAVKSGATHVLWLDSDMIFPADTLERLLAASLDGKPIVAANYAQRKEPVKPVAAKGGFWLYTETDATGLEKADYVGSGVMLVETAVYEHLPMPWYCVGWNEAKKRMVGEDVYFCRKAHGIGAETWIDHDLSKEIYHVGLRNFHLDDALSARPGLLEQQGGDTVPAT